MKPVLLNPYIVGNPIKSREMFFGREDDFLFVARKIGEGRSNQIVVLCGERRSGKTSILFQILGGRLGMTFLPILIDMQMLAGIKGDLEFFRAILRSGYAALNSVGIAGELEEPGAGIESAERLMESFLTLVREKAPGKIVLFLLDEYELIEAKIRDGTLSESTVHYLAGVLEGAFPASFVFTGSTNLEDRNPEIWRMLLGKSVYRKISYLSHRDTVRLITEPLKETVPYPENVVETICRLTGGQPFYTQVICQNMVDLLIDDDRVDPTSEDLEHIVREIVANPLPQMIYSWNSFAPWNRIMLSSLAANLQEASDWSESRRIIQHIWDSRILMPFSRERANVLLEDAYHKEFLEKNDLGAYRFRMDVFRSWIQREQSIWKVVKEAEVGFRRALRSVVIPIGIGLVALAALVAVWLLAVPIVSPSVAAWARNHHLMPKAPALKSETPMEVKNVSYTANRGPFTVVVDGVYTQTSSRDTFGLTWMLASSLPSGPHNFVATGPHGEIVEKLNEIVDQIHNSVFFSFPQTEIPPSEIDGRLTEARCDAQTVARMKAALSQGYSLLVVMTDPAGASVDLANETVGVTPLALQITTGYHPVLITKEGHKPQTASFNAEAGKAYLQDFTLQVNRTALVFEGRDPADIYLGDTLVTTLPDNKTKLWTSGTYVLRIQNQKTHQATEKSVTLVPGTVFPVKEEDK
jgi:hypothetical protein